MGNHCDFPVSIMNPIDWMAQEKESNEKPPDLTPEDIAQAAVMSGMTPHNQVNYAEAIITKMDAPLRILLQHGNGDDLDLSTSPGKEIEAYFKRLSHDIGIPITITTRDKKDNNVSIILARNFMHRFDCVAEEPAVGRDKIDLDTTQTGAIMGVTELDANTRTLEAANNNKFNQSGAWKGSTMMFPVEGHKAPSFSRQFIAKEEIKACIIFIDTYFDHSDVVDRVISNINYSVRSCGGISEYWTSRFKIDTVRRQKLFNALARHQRYFWKLFAHIKSGMSAPDTEKIILQQIQTQQ